MSQRDPNDSVDPTNPAVPGAAKPPQKSSVLESFGRTAVYDPSQAPAQGAPLPFAQSPAAPLPAAPSYAPAPAFQGQPSAGQAAVPASPWASGSPAAPTWGQSAVAASPPVVSRAVPEPAAAARAPIPARGPVISSAGALPPLETVELLFYGPGAPARIQKQRAWQELFEAVEIPPEAEEIDDEIPPGRRPLPKERFDVLNVLARAPVVGPDGIAAAATQAAGEHGAFVPPLVAASGELEFLFEELDMLKATVAAVTPLVGTDKRLKDAVDAVHEMMKTPWVQGAPSVVEGLTAQVREAFMQARRSLPADYLDGHVERMLLAHRNYQRRVAWGQTRIRCLFTAAGAREALFAYLPEGVRELPAFARMKVRMVAEVRGQVEPGGGPWVLRVLAMGRVVGK